MIPVLLDVNGKAVLVVGAGHVGQRKAEAFRAEGAEVTLWDLKTAPPQKTTRGEVLERLRPFDLLVLATDDSAYNEWLSACARELGIWCNRADAGSLGDFQTLSTVRRGPLSIAIGTEGEAPGLSKSLAKALDQGLPKDLGTAVSEIGDLRRAMLAAPEEDKDRLRAALKRDIEALVAKVTDRWPSKR